MAKSYFDLAHEFTARWEGGLDDNPADRGGLTAFGASFQFVKDIAATASGRNFLAAINVSPLPVTKTTIRNLTKAQARAMFRREFWEKPGLDDFPWRPAAILYDMHVNHGPRNAVRIAQRGYNACVTHGVKLATDGIMGPLTRNALVKTDTAPVARAIIQARRDFYRAIVENDASQKVFLNGWLNRADALERMVLGNAQ